MVLTAKFNTYFKDGQTPDLLLGLYISSNYGSNAFDFAQVARIATPVNDRAEGPSTEHVKPAHLPSTGVK